MWCKYFFPNLLFVFDFACGIFSPMQKLFLKFYMAKMTTLFFLCFLFLIHDWKGFPSPGQKGIHDFFWEYCDLIIYIWIPNLFRVYFVIFLEVWIQFYLFFQWLSSFSNITYLKILLFPIDFDPTFIRCQIFTFRTFFLFCFIGVSVCSYVSNTLFWLVKFYSVFSPLEELVTFHHCSFNWLPWLFLHAYFLQSSWLF